MSAAQPLLQHAPSPADALASLETAAQKQDQATALATKAREFTDAVVFGIINGIVGIPTMISFATIIYKVMLRASDMLSILCHLSCNASSVSMSLGGRTQHTANIWEIWRSWASLRAASTRQSSLSCLRCRTRSGKCRRAPTTVHLLSTSASHTWVCGVTHHSS